MGGGVKTQENKMIKAVLDTNIYVSAFGFGGKPKEIIKLALADKFRIVISKFIIDETVIICTKKIGLKKSEILHLLDEIVYFSDVITPYSELNITKNGADNIILATAFDGDADYLVTGDKQHLLPIKEFRGIEILNANDFMRLIA